MMRPVSVNVNWSLPAAPSALTYSGGVLRWTDGTPFDSSPQAWRTLQSEIGFRIERADVPESGDPVFAQVGAAIANADSYIDSTVVPGASYLYRVTAWNEAGATSSNVESVVATVAAGIVPTSLELTSAANPTEVGAAASFTAAVSAASGVATGSVIFSVNDTEAATVALVDGSATFDTSDLAAGMQKITARYTGDVDYAPSTDMVLQLVTKVHTSVLLESDWSAAPAMEEVTFTASVTPSAATGTVTFTFDRGRGSVATRKVEVVEGVATLALSNLMIGQHSVDATYSGDSIHASSVSDPITQIIEAIDTATTLTSDVNPVLVGEPVVFTALVEALTGPDTPTGVVVFTITNPGAPNTTATAALDDTGHATYTATQLVAGSHTVTARYSTTLPWAASESGPLVQVVDKWPSSVAVTSSLGTATYGQPVTYTATMNTAAATGSVVFTVDGVTKYTAPLDTNGRALLVLATQPVGQHTVTAAYGGSALYLPSVSPAVTTTVVKANTVVTLRSSAATAKRGTVVTFTATVTVVSPGVAVAAGAMVFTIDGRPYYVWVGQGGIARYSTKAMKVGTHTVTATYLGDSNSNASVRRSLTQRIR